MRVISLIKFCCSEIVKYLNWKLLTIPAYYVWIIWTFKQKAELILCILAFWTWHFLASLYCVISVWQFPLCFQTQRAQPGAYSLDLSFRSIRSKLLKPLTCPCAVAQSCRRSDPPQPAMSGLRRSQQMPARLEMQLKTGKKLAITRAFDNAQEGKLFQRKSCCYSDT